jgi:transcriptional regulator with XRE-family HTH domain
MTVLRMVQYGIMKPTPDLIRKENFDGQRVYHRRLELGLTLEQVGSLVEKDPSTVHAWEKGAWRPNPSGIAALAKALQVPVGYFFGLEPS